MALFKYVVFNQQGEKKHGVVSATNEEYSRKILEEKGFIVVDIKEKIEINFFSFFDRIKKHLSLYLLYGNFLCFSLLLFLVLNLLIWLLNIQKVVV